MGTPELERWAQIRAWLAELRALDAAMFGTGLSPAGAREAWTAALDALDDDTLADLASSPGDPWPTAQLVSARGAFTAPLEWLVALLGRGSAVRWKVPAGDPTAGPIAAAARDLPLTVHDDRTLAGDVVIAMGSDEGVDGIRASLPRTTPYVGFGHRFSASWITGAPLPPDPRVPAGWESGWAGLAADLALHDSRGCLTPALAFTPVDLEDAGAALAAHMAAAEARWPRGATTDDEHARLRARRALARAAGRVWEGDGWTVLALPLANVEPVALPRVAVIHPASTAQIARDALDPWARWLSSVAVDDGARFGPYVRHCRPGRMQRPELDRLHDGVRWLDWTTRPGGAQPG